FLINLGCPFPSPRTLSSQPSWRKRNIKTSLVADIRILLRIIQERRYADPSRFKSCFLPTKVYGYSVAEPDPSHRRRRNKRAPIQHSFRQKLLVSAAVQSRSLS